MSTARRSGIGRPGTGGGQRSGAGDVSYVEAAGLGDDDVMRKPLNEWFVGEGLAGGAAAGAPDINAIVSQKPVDVVDLLVADVGGRVGVHGEGADKVDDGHPVPAFAVAVVIVGDELEDGFAHGI